MSLFGLAFLLDVFKSLLLVCFIEIFSVLKSFSKFYSKIKIKFVFIAIYYCCFSVSNKSGMERKLLKLKI